MALDAHKTVKFISEDIVRFDAGSRLCDLYAQMNGRELLVEPLSALQPIDRFLAEGGLGFGSAREGSFAATICRVKTDRFDYGSDWQTLYNVGYPLQRLVEGAPHGLLGSEVSLGRPLELTVYARPRLERVAVFRQASPQEIEPPDEAPDAFFVNEAGARLLGLAGAGLAAIFPKDLAPEGPVAEGLWGRRFFVDALPKGQATFKALVPASLLGRSVELADGAKAALFALFTHLGLLMVVGGESEALRILEREVLSAPLTWRLPPGP